MKNEVRLIKLTSGEQIISLVSKTDDLYTLLKPVSLVQVGQNQIGMRPWLGGAKFSLPVQIKEEQIVLLAEVEEEILREYKEQYHDGIAVATPQESRLVLNG